MPYRHLAEAVLVLHAGFAAFVVLGLLAIWWGNVRRWCWVNALWFRCCHLGAIAVVVLESWLGAVCPLTTLESWLRQQAGAPAYSTGFIEHWLGALLYWDAPAWLFQAIYTVFGLAVVLSWLIVPPARGRREEKGEG